MDEKKNWTWCSINKKKKVELKLHQSKYMQRRFWIYLSKKMLLYNFSEDFVHIFSYKEIDISLTTIFPTWISIKFTLFEIYI